MINSSLYMVIVFEHGLEAFALARLNGLDEEALAIVDGGHEEGAALPRRALTLHGIII